MWRRHEIEKAEKEDEEYNLRVQNAQQERQKELEMGMAGPRGLTGPKTKVTFDYGAATATPESPRSAGARQTSLKGQERVPATSVCMLSVEEVLSDFF